MPTLVRELSGSGRGVESSGLDGKLIYPKVSSCMAVAALGQGRLHGAHVTVADRGRLAWVRETLLGRAGPDAPFYLAGHLGNYNVGPFGARPRKVTLPAGEIDIMLKIEGSDVACYVRPAAGEPASEAGFQRVVWGF